MFSAHSHFRVPRLRVLNYCVHREHGRVDCVKAKELAYTREAPDTMGIGLMTEYVVSVP
jgi:hypothetical protein